MRGRSSDDVNDGTPRTEFVITPSDRFNSTGATLTREDYERRHALAYPHIDGEVPA